MCIYFVWFSRKGMETLKLIFNKFYINFNVFLNFEFSYEKISIILNVFWKFEIFTRKKLVKIASPLLATISLQFLSHVCKTAFSIFKLKIYGIIFLSLLSSVRWWTTIYLIRKRKTRERRVERMAIERGGTLLIWVIEWLREGFCN